MILMELLASTPVYETVGSRRINIAGIATNPEDVREGYIFIYCGGQDYMSYESAAEQAVRQGAAAICINRDYDMPDYPVTYIKTYNVKRFLSAVARNFYQNPSQSMNLVGITGSHGKTTVCWMLRSILKCYGTECITLGMSGYQMTGGAYSEYEDGFDPAAIHSSLRKAVDKGIRQGIIECSYTAIVEDILRHIRFDSLIYTDLYTFFKNRLADYHYLEIRKNLIDYLKFTNSPIVVNMDDLYAHELIRSTTVTYGLFNSHDITASDIYLSDKGSGFILSAPEGSCRIDIKAPGIYNVYNAMAAAAWGITEGIPLHVVKEGLETFLPGSIDVQNDPVVGNINVKFADAAFYTNPELTYKNLKNLIKGKIITLLVAGERKKDEDYRKIGSLASVYGEKIIITSDYNSLSHSTDADLAIAQGFHEDDASYETDNFKALQKAVNLCSDGDTVLVIR